MGIMRSDFARCTLVGLLTFSLFCIACKDGELSGSEEDNNKEEVSPYVTKVLEYVPAPGFFVNLYPEYEVGDNEETMREKALLAIGGSSYEFVTLGGYGGYVVLGFDHTIENVPGERDFLILGNVFYSTGPFDGASCEPGIVMVAYDANGNGEPDDDEWFEIAGSAHVDSTAEEWYETALLAGSDIEFYNNFEINYLEQSDGSIIWSDNKGGTGSAVGFLPRWLSLSEMQFSGSRLPENAINIAVEGASERYFLCKFNYGYADNALNSEDDAAIDISWAIDGEGNYVELPGVDFIKIYTGVNQQNGALGECSTEVMGVIDLHL